MVVPAAASDTPVEYKQWMQAERIMEVPAAVPAAAATAAAATAAEAIAAATAAKPAAAAIVIALGTKHSVAKAAAAAIVKVPKSLSISALGALAERIHPQEIDRRQRELTHHPAEEQGAGRSGREECVAEDKEGDAGGGETPSARVQR